MLQFLRVTKLILAFSGVAVHPVGAAPPSYEDPHVIHERARLALEGRWLDLQQLEAEQRTLPFQRRQELLRQRARQITPPAGELQIPRMQRSCQVQPYGSRWLASCR
jgi:hypothetical protein